MHFLKLVMSHGLDTAPMLEAAEEEESRSSGGFIENVNQGTMVNSGAPSSGAVGGMREWSDASNAVIKSHQSYRPSTTRSSSASSSFRFADSNKQLLRVFTVIGLILIFSNFTKMSGVSAMPRCPPQLGVEGEEPGDCSYGITNDYCGRKVCAKGPGQICGVGLFKLLGSCGEGLYCNCGRCTGCSLLTMECYDKTCV